MVGSPFLIDSNLQGIIQGHLDTPLNDHGRFEAAQLGKALASIKFDEAYSSPLSRAHETAEIVLKQHPELELVADEGLKERCLGTLEGHRRPPGPWTAEGAETHDDLPGDPLDHASGIRAAPTLSGARILTWFRGFLKAHTLPEDLRPRTGTNNPDEPRILVLSHGAWIAQFCRVLISEAVRAKVAREVDLRAHLLNTCLMKVRCVQGRKGWSVELLSFGDMSHLKGTKEPDLEVADDV